MNNTSEFCGKAKGAINYLLEWRERLRTERHSEESCRERNMEDQAKWHEGQADALERCLSELEFGILPELRIAQALAEDRKLQILQLRQHEQIIEIDENGKVTGGSPV